MATRNQNAERAKLLESYYDTDDEDDAFDAQPYKTVGGSGAPPSSSGSSGRKPSSSSNNTATTTADASNSKLQQVKAQVGEVIEVMHQNIEKVIDRGIKLDEINDKTDQLSESARSFSSRSRQLRRHMWWKNTKLQLCICGCILLILVIVIASIVIRNKSS